MDTLSSQRSGGAVPAGLNLSWEGIANEQSAFHPTTIRLFLAVAAYVACPLIEIPLLGISLSMPLMYLVALEVFLRSPEPWLREHRRWIAFIVAIWLSKFFSAMFNGLIGTGIDRDGFTLLFRYGYWLVAVFLITVYLVPRANLGRRILQAMVYGLVITALLRWFEALAWGKIGAWVGTRFFTQNGYGVLFSTCTPLLLTLIIDLETKHRNWTLVAGVLVFGAAAINGSRGSWVAIATACCFFTFIYLLAYPKRVKGMMWIGLLVSGILGLVALAPAHVIAPVSERFATLEHVEEAKTYVARQLMVQKGLKLFRASPLIGVGPTRWRKVFVPLDIPDRLPQDQVRYNRKTAHNSYIYILAETGLIGTLAVGSFLLYLVVRGGLAAIALTREGQLWALGIYAGFVGMSVHFWVLGGMTGTAPWMMYGLVAAIIMIHERGSYSTSERKESCN